MSQSFHRILALDSSQLQASVCALEEGKLVAQRSGSVDVAHSEALLPHIHELLEDCGWTLSSVDAFGAGVGPGSFTGIRIGCATIKGLAQVLKVPVLPFSSLRALALSVQDARPEDAVVAFVNAYQGQVFAGWHDSSGRWREDSLTAMGWRQAHSTQFLPASRLLFCGTGAKLYWSEIAQIPGAELTPVAFASPDGVALAVQGALPVSYIELSANYLRPSQAEAKLSALAK